MQTNPNDNTNTMTVDIRLCGNIPRNEMRFGAPKLSLTSRLNAGCLAETNGNSTLRKTTLCDEPSAALTDIFPDMKQFEAALQNVVPLEMLIPSWAVAARGEAKLEPACESIGRQTAVDLTVKKAFRIGRSPSCDVQLMHATSSRRHALVFHHSNGSCYVVDCGSGHGTYVNGKRISPPSSSGVVVPYKVRRGSLIRFGGPGAPCFVLKSFAIRTTDIESEKLRHNTRLNALGKTEIVNRKRSCDSLSSEETFDCKRVRCSSPPLIPEVPLRLVSPDPPFSKPRRVTFSVDPPQMYES